MFNVERFTKWFNDVECRVPILINYSHLTQIYGKYLFLLSIQPVINKDFAFGREKKMYSSAVSQLSC